jgi:protein phosphatase
MFRSSEPKSAEPPPPKPNFALPSDDFPFELDGPEATIHGLGGSGTADRSSDQSTESLGLDCLDIGAASSPGKVRDRNEDSFLIMRLHWSNLDRRRELALVVVADGMGGHDAGDIAGGMSIRTIGASLSGLLTRALSDPAAVLSPAILSDAVAAAMHEANRTIRDHAKKQPNFRGMGATAAVILIADGYAVVGHVGDCRVYHQTGDELRQMTRDQTLVGRMVELGRLTAEEALIHPSRNEVTQALGQFPDLSPSLLEAKLASGDWLIAASDGLHAHVQPSELPAVISRARSAMVLAHRLVGMADQGGGSDNCTVATVRQC